MHTHTYTHTAQEFLKINMSAERTSAIILAGATPYAQQHMLLSPLQHAMMFTLVMTHAASYSVFVSNTK